MQKIPMTQKEFRMLEEELHQLKEIRRPNILKAITVARALGDLSENAEYHAAKEEQGMIEARLKYIEGRLYNAEVIDISKLHGDTVTFGATVTVCDEHTDTKHRYQIVGTEEADPNEGRLPVTSPLAKALIGKKVGATIEFASPKGMQEYTVEQIEFLG